MTTPAALAVVIPAGKTNAGVSPIDLFVAGARATAQSGT
jgi:hypothetical protein